MMIRIRTPLFALLVSLVCGCSSIDLREEYSAEQDEAWMPRYIAQSLADDQSKYAPSGAWLPHWEHAKINRHKKRKDAWSAEGRFTAWYPDGTKSAEGQCLGGKMDGLWIMWHTNGSISKELLFDSEKLVSAKYYSENGCLRLLEVFGHPSFNELEVVFDPEGREVVTRINDREDKLTRIRKDYKNGVHVRTRKQMPFGEWEIVYPLEKDRNKTPNQTLQQTATNE